MNHILYISALASERKINLEYQHTGKNPGFAVQKFSRLLVKGLMANGIDVEALSNSPNTWNRAIIFKPTRENEKGVSYRYIPYVNLPFLKHLCLFFYSFFYVLTWGIYDRKNKSIVCDVLSISICLGALLATKINRIQAVGVVTDIYEMMIGNGRISFISKLAAKLNSKYVSCFNKYLLLTEQMNDIVNLHNRPYIVMEALCDSSLMTVSKNLVSKKYPKEVIYAGGIYEKYGLKMLAEGFVRANVQGAKLVYYGEGSFVDEYKALCARHPNLEYRGVASNDEILEAEQKATLLVNPRFSTEEFTKYSFPSKNMEYMASGTPLLTTKLPGMPKEYDNYIFLIEKETIEGFADAIKHVLKCSMEELKEFGNKSRNFVLLNKNNIIQGKRVADFIFESNKEKQRQHIN